MAFGAVFATASELEAASPRREIIVTGAERAWISVLPLTASGESTKLAAKENESALLPDIPGLLFICAGAKDRATLCERAPAEGDFLHTFSLGEGRLVTGRCFIGRRPAAGATVSVRPARVEARRPLVIPLTTAAEGNWVTAARVDDDGLYRIPHLAPAEYVFEIITADGRAEDSAVVTIPIRKASGPGQALSPRELEVPEIRLAEGVLLSVEVQTTDGKPVANAFVSVHQDSDDDAPDRTFERKANEVGVAAFDGIDARLPVRIGCAARGFTQFSGTLETAPPITTCVLARLGTINGTVLNSEKQAVAGATVEFPGDKRMRTSSDATGAFSLSEIAAGTYRIRASSTRTGSAVKDISLGEGEVLDIGAMELGDLDAVYGVVVSAATGEPIAGASVAAIDPSGMATSTDAEGTFVLDCDPAMMTTIEVSATGYARAQSSVRPSSSETRATIRLERPGTLEVTAWEDDGSPCRGCTITAAGPGGVRSIFTNGHGSARVDGLTPGEYVVNRERVSSTSRQVTVSGGGDSRLEVVRANAVTHVELGSPARPLRVRVNPALPPDHVLRAYGAERTMTTALAEPDGSFSFRRTRGETYDLRVESRAGGVFVGQVVSGFSGDTFSVQLGAGMVEARVTAARAGAGDLVLFLLNAAGGRAAWARTDAAGVARFMYLQPGTYTAAIGQRVLGTVISRPGTVGSLTVALEE